MTFPQFKRWLEKQRKELAHASEYYDNCDYGSYVAATIATEASKLAADLRLPELMREWEVRAEVLEVDQYLVECLATIPGSDYLKPPEIAEQLGTAPETVIGWIKSGQLKGSNLATDNRPRYVVTPDSLAEFLKSRQPQPPVKRQPKAKPAYKRFSE